jgi:hypothetical protein
MKRGLVLRRRRRIPILRLAMLETSEVIESFGDARIVEVQSEYTSSVVTKAKRKERVRVACSRGNHHCISDRVIESPITCNPPQDESLAIHRCVDGW